MAFGFAGGDRNAANCPPDGVTMASLCAWWWPKFEKLPKRLHEDFVVPVSAVMIAHWLCRK
jgi:hypothetical protein